MGRTGGSRKAVCGASYSTSSTGGTLMVRCSFMPYLWCSFCSPISFTSTGNANSTITPRTMEKKLGLSFAPRYNTTYPKKPMRGAQFESHADVFGKPTEPPLGAVQVFDFQVQCCHPRQLLKPSKLQPQRHAPGFDARPFFFGWLLLPYLYHPRLDAFQFPP